MKQTGQNHEGMGGVIVRACWQLRLFLGLWTGVVVIFVFWLLSVHPTRSDFLIAFGPGAASSPASRIREWLVGHVAIEWAYPWILLAPYVVWFGFKVAAARRGVGWWLAAQILAGATFVVVSQGIMQQLQRHRPRSIWIQRDSIVRERGLGEGKETNSFQIARSISWPDGGTRVVAQVATGQFNHTDLTPFTAPDTNIEWESSIGEARLVVLHKDYPLTNGVGALATNHFADSNAFPELPTALASNLVSVVEAQLKAFPNPPMPGGPRKFSALLDVMAYAAMIGLTQAVHFRRRLAEREKQTMLLESQLAQAQLRALHSQLQPHFLFNTLNGIAMLVRRDPRMAEDMIGSLSELLRWSLQRSGSQVIPLRDELEFLDRYLEIQQMRFGDRLRVERRVESGTLDYLVPPLILQPLVENAVRHGIEPSPHPGLLIITARVENGMLMLQVEDDGVGLDPGRAMGGNDVSGLGIASVKERLAGQYGGQHSFVFENRPSGGVIVAIRFPLRSAI